MPTFQQLLNNLEKTPEPQKQIEYINQFRRDCINDICKITGRDLIIYASDIKKIHPTGAINWDDKTCFSDVVEGLSNKSVDIIVQSPGGSAEATESIVGILRENFENIRFIVPNMAKSAATMLVLSGDEVMMDERSELGPIDPQIQINGLFVPAQTVIDGFEEAKKVISEAGASMLTPYLPLLNKYDLHILQICENAKKLSEKLVRDWLKDYMFKKDPKRTKKATNIAKKLADHKKYLSHGRPIKISDALKLGINVSDLRKNQALRGKIWDLYCVIEILMDRSQIIKMYENSKGVFLIKNIPLAVR